MLPELAPEHAAVFALLLADDLPRGLERVRANAARVQGHLGAVDGAVDVVRPPAGQAQADGVDLVNVAEDLELEFRGDRGEGCAWVRLLREHRQSSHHVWRHLEFPLGLLWGGQVCLRARETIEIRVRPVRRGRG